MNEINNGQNQMYLCIKILKLSHYCLINFSFIKLTIRLKYSMAVHFLVYSLFSFFFLVVSLMSLQQQQIK